MIYIGSFVLVIGVLVFVHELGHYLAARSVGVRIEKFSIGFPPRFISLTSVKDGWDITVGGLFPLMTPEQMFEDFSEEDCEDILDGDFD